MCFVNNMFSFLLLTKDRVKTLLANKCKCAQGNCYDRFDYKEVKSFLDTFASRSKREQDSILFMACNDDHSMKMRKRRKEYQFLGKQLGRSCFEALIGLSSHRVDRIGAIDRRYKDTKDPGKPSPLTASIDAFAMVLYNSVAEPLPNKLLRLDH